MIINRANLENIATAFSAVYNKAFAEQPNRLPEIATVVPVTTTPINFPIVAIAADLREWLGDRVIASIGAWNKPLDIKDFERTIGIERDAILDDQLGLYEPAVRDLAGIAASYPWRASLDALMTDGFDAAIPGFDAVPFFSANHIWPGANDVAQDNLTDELLDSTAVWTAIQFFRTVQGPDGRAMDLDVRSPNGKFVCAADLESTARTLFLNERDAAGASNPLFGWFKEGDIIVSGRVAAKRWAILYTGRAVKPLVMANRQEAQFVPMTAPDDEAAFMRKQHRYGVDSRFRVFALGWWMGYGSNGAGS